MDTRAFPLVPMDSRSPALTLAAVAAIALSLAVGLSHPVLNLNEGLYARVAQEMLASGSWIVPTLDGVPYLEKPPLLYWLTAGAFALFGVSGWTARLAPVLGSVLMLRATYVFTARHRDRRVALYAVAILASSPLVVGVGRTLIFDGLFTGLLSCALVALHEGLTQERGRAWMRASAALLALAILAKGLAALIFYGAIAAVLVAVARREARRAMLARFGDPVAIALFLAIAVPWHVLASVKEPGFAWFYFVNEHVLRFLGQREPHDYHTGPAWYYLPRIAAYAMPWILLLVLPARLPRGTALRGFLAAWILVPLAVFSLSSAKGDYYMIVGLPPLAILLAERVRALEGSRLPALVPVAWIVVLGVLVLALPRLSADVHLPALWRPLLALGLALAAASTAAFALRRTAPAVAACAAVAIPVALLFSGFLAANEDARSARRLASDIRHRGLASVYLYRDYEKLSALPFYLGHPVGVVDSRSRDLWYGLRLAPDPRRFPSLVAFDGMLAGGPMAVVVDASALADFRKTALARRLSRVDRYGDAFLYVGPAERLVSASQRDALAPAFAAR